MRARRHAGKERRHRRSERTREFFDNLGQSMRRRRSDAINSGQAGARQPCLRIDVQKLKYLCQQPGERCVVSL